MNLAKQWWKALVSWWERQRPFRRSNVDLWHPERQVMPNAVAEPHRPNKRAVTGDHRAVETSDDFSHFYAVQLPTNPLAERRARAEELLRKLHE